MALTRKKFWDTRDFHQFLQQRKNSPFEWGVHDCALFAADGIEAITGVDIASAFRGKYSDEAGARAAIKEVCNGETVADAAAWCAAQHGLRELQHPLMAQRGDLVIYEDVVTGQPISGIVHLSGRHLVAAGPRGLKRVGIHMVRRAWHV